MAHVRFRLQPKKQGTEPRPVAGAWYSRSVCADPGSRGGGAGAPSQTVEEISAGPPTPPLPS